MPKLRSAEPPNKKPAVVQVFDAVSNRLALAVNDVSHIPESALLGKYAKYAQAPDKFIWEVLGVRLAKDAQRLCDSVVTSDITVARSANGVGKSHVAAHLAIWFFLTFPESKVFLFAAPPERNLRQILWGAVGTIYRKNPHLFEGMQVSMPSMSIKRHDESFLTGVTIPVSLAPEDMEARFSGKHAPDMFFCGDEADAIPQPVFKGIESCASGGRVHQLYNFNPRREAGPMAKMEKEGLANVVELSAFRHPNVITGKDIIPGAVTRETTVRRINMWTRPLSSSERPDGECFEVPKFLTGVVAKSPNGQMYPPLAPGWRKVLTAEFWYMVLGKYPPQSESQLINKVWLEAAFDRWDNYVSKYGERPPSGVYPTSGLDVAEFGPDFNFLTHRYDWFVASPESWNGVDTDITAKKAARSCRDVNAAKCNVDANGVGNNVPFSMARHYDYKLGVPIIPQERAPDNPNPGPDEVQGRLVRDEMAWRFREWLRTNPKAALPRSENLKEECLAPTYHKNPTSGKIEITDGDTLKEILGRSPDHFWSVCLTFANAKGSGLMRRSKYTRANSKTPRKKAGVLVRR